MGKSKVDELLDDAFVMYTKGSKCWAASLDGEIAEFIERLRASTQAGKPPAYSTVARILASEYGVKQLAQQVSRHLRGECACPAA